MSSTAMGLASQLVGRHQQRPTAAPVDTGTADLGRQAAGLLSQQRVIFVTVAGVLVRTCQPTIVLHHR